MLRRIDVTTQLYYDIGQELVFNPLRRSFEYRTVSDYDSLITIQISTGARIYALGGNDTVRGSMGVDTIDGGDGDDHLEGGGGIDFLFGGNGNDVFLVRSPGDHGLLELVSGDAGFDTMLFEGPGTFVVSPLTRSVELFKLGNKDGSPATVNSNLVGTLLTYGAIFEGNDGSNIILGSVSSDTIRGLGGSDFLVGLAGNDSMQGGAGFDVLLGDGIGLGDIGKLLSLVFGLDTDSFSGLTGILDSALSLLTGRGNDSLDGGDGSDILYGASGNDWLWGGSGLDLLIGGKDDDVIRGGTNAGGGLELDLAGYFLADGSVTVNLATGTASGADGNDTLSEVEGVLGSHYDDDLTGGTSPLTLVMGLDGNDRIQGTDKADNGQTAINLLIGGAGNDTIKGAEGAFNVIAGDGINLFDFLADVPLLGGIIDLLPAPLRSLFTLNDGDDSLEGSNGTDLIIGGGGDDHIQGKGGTDLLFGGSGNDVFLVTQPGDHTLLELTVGNEGFDTMLFQGPGTFVVSPLTFSVELFKLGNKDGTPASDNANLIGTLLTYGAEFQGNEGTNIILGSVFDDTIYGYGGTGILVGLAGDDSITGGDDFDILLGDGILLGDIQKLLNLIFGLDTSAFDGLTDIPDSALELLTGRGNDSLDGAGSTDILYGGAGNDDLWGGSGLDLLIGGKDNDMIDGGDGDLDLAGYLFADGGVMVNLATGMASGADGDDTLSNVEGLLGSHFNDTLTGSDSTYTLILGLDGDDQIQATAKSNSLTHVNLLIGGNDNDIIQGADGALNVIAGDGLSLADVGTAISGIPIIGPIFGPLLSDALDGLIPDDLIPLLGQGNGNDSLVGSSEIDLIFGGDGNDTIKGLGNSDILDGGDGDDQIDGDDGLDVINGGNDADILRGLGGNDNINGDAGADQITGGAGGDRMSGGDGADTFIYTAASEAGVPQINVGNGLSFNQGTRALAGAAAQLAGTIGGTYDLITDFNILEDKIDLSAIDAISGGADDAFTFDGTFSNGGLGSLSGRPTDGQVKYQATGGLTYVAANIGGSNNDLVLVLQGELALSATNFIL